MYCSCLDRDEQDLLIIDVISMKEAEHKHLLQLQEEANSIYINPVHSVSSFPGEFVASKTMFERYLVHS